MIEFIDKLADLANIVPPYFLLCNENIAVTNRNIILNLCKISLKCLYIDRFANYLLELSSNKIKNNYEIF